MSNSNLTLAKVSLINDKSACIWNSFGIVSINTPSSVAIRNLAIFDHLDSMITEDIGVMKCRMEGHEELVSCIFELRDMNVTCKLTHWLLCYLDS